MFLIFLLCGILPYLILWFLCNALYNKQASDLLNVIHNIPTLGVTDPMLKFTHNFGNIKFRGFINLLIYLLFGVIDYFTSISWLNFIFSVIILINVFNSFTLITAINKSLSIDEYCKRCGRFLKKCYIYHFIFNIILYVAYIIIL